MVVPCRNMTAHAQKPDFVFRAKRTSPLNSALGRQFSQLLAAEVCASAVVMLDTTMFRSSVKSICYPLHSPVSLFTSPTRASPCAITFQLKSNAGYTMFRGSVKSIVYPLHSPVSPFTSPPVRNCVPSNL